VAHVQPGRAAEHAELVVDAWGELRELDAGERAMARLRGLAGPLADLVWPMPSPELSQFTQDGPGPDHQAARSLVLDAVDLPAAAAIVEHLGPGPRR
jgi:hypothetical protein